MRSSQPLTCSLAGYSGRIMQHATPSGKSGTELGRMKYLWWIRRHSHPISIQLRICGPDKSYGSKAQPQKSHRTVDFCKYCLGSIPTSKANWFNRQHASQVWSCHQGQRRLYHILNIFFSVCFPDFLSYVKILPNGIICTNSEQFFCLPVYMWFLENCSPNLWF